MSWRAIPGFLFKDFWFPFAATHVVTPVEVPTTACKTLCARTTDCCRWAVRDVRSWEDAKDADSGLSELGWVIAGEDITLFATTTTTTNKWCLVKCGTEDFTVKKKDKQLEFDFTTINAEQVKLQLVNVPGNGGANSFYALLLLTNKGIDIFDRNGQLQNTHPKPNALTELHSDPTIGHGVTFVRSFSCGLFKKETSAARLAVEALPGKLGLLKKCGGTQTETECKDSNCDPEAALAAQMERLKNGKWSQDALAESHGVSFASIACAVIASVALVFIVLSVAKKNSHLEIAVADE